MKSRKVWYILLWIFSPIFLLIEGLREQNQELKKYALMLFVIAFGMTLVLTPGVDGDSHVINVERNYMFMSFDTFLQIAGNIITFQGSDIGVKDLFMHCLSFISGAVLGYPRAMFIIVSIIYGYFFIGSFMVIFRNFSQTPKTPILIFLVLTLVFTKNVDGIQSLRNWTACWMGIYAFLKYAQNKNFKYLLLIALTPFIHFSYIIISLPLVIIIIFKERPLIYLIIFIISTFTTTIEPEYIKNLQTNNFFESQVDSYYDDEEITATEKYEARTEEGSASHRAFASSGIHRIPTIILTSLLFFFIGAKKKGVIINKDNRTVFYAGVLMISLSNFSWFLSSLSSRTLIISMILILAAITMLYQTNYRVLRKSTIFTITTYFCLILYLPYIYYSVSVLLLFTSICMIIFPPFALFFPDDNISLHTMLKNL